MTNNDKQKPNVDKLTAKGSFQLGAGNNGANPVTELVTLTVGPFSQTIPVQMFTQKDTRLKTTWTFKGPKGGLTKLVVVKNGDNWTFDAAATGIMLALAANPNPVVIRLQIGDDSGTSSRFFVIKDTPKKVFLKFPAGKKDDADGDEFTIKEGDCDDQDPTTYPGAEELCDGIDNNCNKQIDEGALLTFYRDGDGDEFGTAVQTATGCEPPTGFVLDNQDCN